MFFRRTVCRFPARPLLLFFGWVWVSFTQLSLLNLRLGLAATSSSVNDSILSSFFTFTFDSGSDTHLLTLEAARSLLSRQGLSYLKVLGVSGIPQ